MRKTVLLSLAAGTLALGACGGDDPPVDSDTGGSDAGTDTVPGDTSLDVPDADPVCEGGAPECVRLSDCASAGFNSPSCVEGCCVDQDDPTDPPCASHLSECLTDAQTTDDFFCDTDAGLCLQRCDFDSASDTQSADCPLNSYCLSELNGVEDDQLNGVCIPGDCESNMFDPDACGGTGTCLPVGNGASYCIEGGTAGEGDSCDMIDTNQPASDICAPGSLCFFSECIVPCDRRNGDDDCTVEGEDCLGVYDTTPRNQPGLCGVGCEPFSRDECGEETCSPVFGRFGINGWACAAGPVEPAGEGEDCTSVSVECDEGLICIEVTDGVRECLQMCDPAGGSDVPTAACPGGATGGETLIGLTAFGEVSGYWAGDAGDYAGEVRTDDGTFIIGHTLEIDDGGVTSAVISVDDAGVVDTFTLDDFTLEDDLPAQGLRVVHAAHSVGSVDVYLDQQIAAGVGTGDDLLSVDVDPGEYSVSGRDFTLFEAGMVYRATDTDGAYDPASIELDADVGLRFYHGIVGGPALDIYICSDDDGGFGDCDTDEFWLLGEGITEGQCAPETGTFMIGTNPVGSLVWGVVAGTNPAEYADEDVIFFGRPDFETASLYQLTAVFTDVHELVFDALPTSTPEGRAIILFQSFGPDPIDFTLTWGPIEEAVVYGDASSGTDSAYFDVDPGSYGVSLVDEEENWMRSDVLEVEEGALATIFAADGEDAPTFFSVFDDFETPADGQGATRIVHAAAGAGSVQVTAPGEADVVCTPSAVDGFGFCQEACIPYPRRVGDYGCDDETSTCLPFVARDDRPVEPQGFCSEDGGTASAGEGCSNDGFLGGDCLDFAVCLDLEDDGSAACLPLCEPFSIGSCADFPDFSTCSGIPPLVGQLNFSFCIDAQPGNIGDRCTETGLPCAADNSICLDMGSGPTCLGVCRAGFDDCDAFGQTCNTGDLNPDVVPSYMGLCR